MDEVQATRRESQMQSEQIDKLAPALIALQAELPLIRRDARNTYFNSRYATLGAIVDSIRDLLHKHEFAVCSTFSEPIGEAVPIHTKLLHASGQWIQSDLHMPLGKSPSPQAVGSAITYGRRYGICAVLNIATDDDDDGNAAQHSTERKPAEKTNTHVPSSRAGAHRTERAPGPPPVKTARKSVSRY